MPEGPDGTAALATSRARCAPSLCSARPELGLGASRAKGSNPKLARTSRAARDFDVYAERRCAARDEWTACASTGCRRAGRDDTAPGQSAQDIFGARLQQFVDARYRVLRESGYRPQVAAGPTTRASTTTRHVPLGAEYFYNPLGYSTRMCTLGCWHRAKYAADPATFFYLGSTTPQCSSHFPRRSRSDLHTFSMSTLGNSQIARAQFISRLDYRCWS